MVVTYVCRIRGILTQFAAATAANGTYLPIRGGADCENDATKIILQHESDTSFLSNLVQFISTLWLIITIDTPVSVAHRYRYAYTLPLLSGLIPRLQQQLLLWQIHNLCRVA